MAYTMLESVAAAIMRANFSRPVEIQGINVSVVDNIDLAQAAIDALRSLAATILEDSGIDTIGADQNEWLFVDKYRCEQIWHTMLVAVINGKGPG